jgi:hypothetical protein
MAFICPPASQLLIYTGGAEGLGTTPFALRDYAQSLGQGPVTVAALGDIDGDGFDDIGVRGRSGAHVFRGGTTDITDWVTIGNLDSYPSASAGLGDVNGDGLPDLSIGPVAPSAVVGVYFGRSTGFSTEVLSLPDPFSNQDPPSFGQTLASAGDVNGDGYLDLIVGAPWAYAESSQYGGGRAYIYLGDRLEPLSKSPIELVGADIPGSGFGGSVGSLGDVNGDGYDDVVAGESCYQTACAPGHFYLYFGSSSGVQMPAVRVDAPAGTSEFGIAFAAGP